MKKNYILPVLTLFLISLFLFDANSAFGQFEGSVIQKRKYRKGYHINLFKKKVKKNNKKNELKEDTKKIEIAKITEEEPVINLEDIKISEEEVEVFASVETEGIILSSVENEKIDEKAMIVRKKDNKAKIKLNYKTFKNVKSKIKKEIKAKKKENKTNKKFKRTWSILSFVVGILAILMSSFSPAIGVLPAVLLGLIAIGFGLLGEPSIFLSGIGAGALAILMSLLFR